MSSTLKREPKKTDTSHWDKNHGIIHTKKGGLVIGETVYSHGYSMMDDLVGKTTFFQVLLLNVTGRLPERRLTDWLEALFICLSYPDARIWCNQIGSLAGTMRASPVAAVCAGTLAADSRLYGPGTLPAATHFIKKALVKKHNGMSAESIVKEHPKRHSDGTPIISGYARPLIRGDERLTVMEQLTKQLGFETGKHLALAYEIHEVLSQKYDESINLVGYCVAFLCDQGFNGQEIYRMLSTWVNSGVHACFVEADDNHPESFFPIRCDDIDYQGKPPRSLPENKANSTGLSFEYDFLKHQT